MKERIKQLRKELGLNQTLFAAKINRSQNTIANYEIGNLNIPDRTITDICREFNVNEQWLRTGEGLMFNPPKDTDTELTNAIGELLNTDDEFTKKLILSYLKLSDEQRKVVREFWTQIHSEEQK